MSPDIGNVHPLEEAQAEATLDQIATTVYDWFSRGKKLVPDFRRGGN